ncbi:hypothetical protein GGI16_002765 [Coemansia sp. S142-1]|nr:hypothetical protein GGI16_002765 [Coemansia sp. S142-1]KAJ2348169.1 hypothetical protein GGH92_002920 [Coemansia sp. RSA 2673]
MAHAAVPTASKLSHYNPDLPAECKFSYTLSGSNGAARNSQHAPREAIVHYFWLCPRIQDFWQWVSCFIQGIHDAPNGPIFRVRQNPKCRRTTQSGSLEGFALEQSCDWMAKGSTVWLCSSLKICCYLM